LLKQMVPQATRLGIVERPEARDESNAAQLELWSSSLGSAATCQG
jgi:hypothetical protein